MRITKKILAEHLCAYFDKLEMPYSVSYKDIETTRFTADQIESGATRLWITARHKTDENYADIHIMSMYNLRELSVEMKRFEFTKIILRDWSRYKLGTFQDMWIEPIKEQTT